MKLVNIGDKDKDSNAVVNIDLPSIVQSIKLLPTWLRYVLSLIIIGTISYFFIFKSRVYTEETTRMDELTVSSVKVNQKIEEVQNILYNYNVILKYYEASLKLIAIKQTMNAERQQMIVEYLGGPCRRSDYERLIKRLEDNSVNSERIAKLYKELQLTSDEKEISRILDNINTVLSRNIKEPKLLNN